MTICEENRARNTGEEMCCLHDLPPGHNEWPGRTCCWCGDIYQPHTISSEHGEYEPLIKSIYEEPAP
jgi:hypothetical protein